MKNSRFAVSLISCAASILLVVGIAPDTQAAEAAKAGPTPVPFSNPQVVTINGYSQDAEEPSISRDGNVLFFDNSNDPARNPNNDIFWATRIDDVTFQYQGPITGVDTQGALEGVPSMDSNHIFYFVTTRNYVAPDFATIYSGEFSNGNVVAVAPVAGISRTKAGWVNFDVEVSADGNTLYFVDGFFRNNQPRKAKLVIAHKNGNAFAHDPRSARIMARINTGRLQYAANISASELEFFFTRLYPAGPATFMAVRSDTSQRFGKPIKIAAITGFAEAPSFSPDGKSLYYHHRDLDGVFRIYRVTRP